jgi:hypothetical protein
VVKIVADDKNNPLVNYAIKNSSTVAKMVANSEAEKLAIWERAREGAVYPLDDTVRMRPAATAAASIQALRTQGLRVGPTGHALLVVRTVDTARRIRRDRKGISALGNASKF